MQVRWILNWPPSDGAHELGWTCVENQNESHGVRQRVPVSRCQRERETNSWVLYLVRICWKLTPAACGLVSLVGSFFNAKWSELDLRTLRSYRVLYGISFLELRRMRGCGGEEFNKKNYARQTRTTSRMREVFRGQGTRTNTHS